MKTSKVLRIVDQKSYDIVEEGNKYAITQPIIKSYDSVQLLVKSSQQPINLGEEMMPYMDLSDLREFMDQHQIARAEDTPLEIYLYNWVAEAQGPMIFQTGCVVDEIDLLLVEQSQFELIQLPPLKMSSIFYIGPFPYQERSGWGQINWEQRAAEAGYEYTAVLYRELYHRYDFDGDNQHITEIEISIR